MLLVDTLTQDQDQFNVPHRSKLSGMLGAILYVNDLCMQFGIDNGLSAEMQCDGKDILKIDPKFNV